MKINNKDLFFRMNMMVEVGCLGVGRIAFVWVLVVGLALGGWAQKVEKDFGKAALSAEERTELIFYAKCARMAYVGEGCSRPLDNYRYLTGEEWAKCGVGERDEGYAYNPTNGYLTVGSGLRGRLMAESKHPSHVIVSLSGCDLNGHDVVASQKDAVTVLGLMNGQHPKQFVEATNLVNWVRRGLSPDKLDVVGHSLGGALTTYVVSVLSDDSGTMRGWTFNGLGLSKALASRDLTPARVQRAEALLTNVKGSRDFAFVLPGTVHYGEIHNLQYRKLELFVDPHGIDELIKRMSYVLNEK